jgi:hypothetical protein
MGKNSSKVLKILEGEFKEDLNGILKRLQALGCPPPDLVFRGFEKF